jgi:hypothetical protein
MNHNWSGEKMTAQQDEETALIVAKLYASWAMQGTGRLNGRLADEADQENSDSQDSQ